MSYIEVLKDAISILGFNEKGIMKISKNPNAVGFGILTIGLSGLFGGIGSLQILTAFIAPIISVLFFGIGFGYLHLMAKLFGGKATAREFFGPLANVNVLSWIAIIPVIGPFINILASLYLAVIQVYIMHKVHRIAIWACILIVVLPLILIFGLVLAVIMLFAVSMGGMAESIASL